MKDRALYHLMQMTAAKLAETGDTPRFRALADTLAVEYNKTSYIVAWDDEGKKSQIEMPDAKFTFFHYTATDRDWRRLNWNAAFDLWEQIAADSNLSIETTRARATLGFEPSLAPSPRSSGMVGLLTHILRSLKRCITQRGA